MFFVFAHSNSQTSSDNSHISSDATNETINADIAEAAVDDDESNKKTDYIILSVAILVVVLAALGRLTVVVSSASNNSENSTSSVHLKILIKCKFLKILLL
jgi:hypothetical protein